MSPLLFAVQVWHVQKFSNDFCECCSVVACRCSLVAEGSPPPPVGTFLSSGISLKGCVLVLQRINLPLAFQLSFQFRKPFSWILPWRTNSLVRKRALWWFRRFFSVWARGAAVSLLGGLCSFKGEGFLPPTPVSLLTLLNASLPPGIILRSRTAMAILGKRIWQVCSCFCC